MAALNRPLSAFIHPTAEVAPDATVGVGTKVWHQAQVMPGAMVGSDCTIGKGAFLSSSVVVGDRVKIGNYANLMGARVANAAFIGPMAYLMEDQNPRATRPDGQRKTEDDWIPTPVHIGIGATIGGGALVLPGVSVSEWAMIAAGSVVHRDVAAYGLVGGNPARQLGWSCRCGQTLDAALACTCGLRYEQGDFGLRSSAPT
jgi:UDP-2-acetamido-3-amino-2,3-dideoxy-glucuronate N-acetyltransferase